MLQDYIQQFLASKRLKAKNTQVFYEQALRFYSQSYPEWPITDISITNFLVDVVDRGCKPATVHAYFRSLRTFCNWLYKRKVFEVNPVDLVDAPKLPFLLPRAPRQVDLIALFNSIEGVDWYGLRDKALLSLALDTGMRISEIANLKAVDLDLEGKTIIIQKSKSARQRSVIFGDTTQYYLRLWLAKKRAMRVSMKVVFLGGLGKADVAPLTGSGIRQILERRLEKAGLAHFRFHDLRHAYAVYFLRNGGNLMDVKKQLGHSNIAVTNVYTQVIDDGREERHERYSPVSNLTKK